MLLDCQIEQNGPFYRNVPVEEAGKFFPQTPGFNWQDLLACLPGLAAREKAEVSPEEAFWLLARIGELAVNPQAGKSAYLPLVRNRLKDHPLSFLEAFSRLEAGETVILKPVAWTDYLGNGIKTLFLARKSREKATKLRNFSDLKRFYLRRFPTALFSPLNCTASPDRMALLKNWEADWLARPEAGKVVYQPYAREKGEALKIDYQDAYFRLQDGLPVVFQPMIWAKRTQERPSAFERKPLKAARPSTCLTLVNLGGTCDFGSEEVRNANPVKGIQVSSLKELEAYARMENERLEPAFNIPAERLA